MQVQKVNLTPFALQDSAAVLDRMVLLCLSLLLFLTRCKHCWDKRGGARLVPAVQPREKDREAKKQLQKLLILGNLCGRHLPSTWNCWCWAWAPAWDSAVPAPGSGGSLTSALLACPRLPCCGTGQHSPCLPTSILAQRGSCSLLKPLLNNVILRMNFKDIVRPSSTPPL